MGPDLHGLGWVGEAKAHLLGFIGLGSFTRRRHHRDLLLFRGHRILLGEVGVHAKGEVDCLGECETLLLTGVGDDEVSLQGKDSSGGWLKALVWFW